jgi:protein TonB
MAQAGSNKRMDARSGQPGRAIDMMAPLPDPLGRVALRTSLMLLLGVMTAFFLFWVMQALITVSGELAESGGRLAIEFVRLRKDRTPELKEREPPKRQKPEQQPPPPEMNVAKAMNPGDAVGEIIPMIDTGVELEQATSLAGGGTDRAPVPLVQVDPEYPPRAQQQGIRGFVEVEFTISPVGTVIDAFVIRSKPPYVFDRAALQAVRRWKYNPQIEGGVAIARPGVQFHFTFEPKGSSR